MTRLRRSIVRVLLALAFLVPATVLGMYAFNPFGVRSMDPRERILPGLAAGQVVVTRPGHYTRHAPERGDVVTLFVPEHEGEVWLQRIVGLPGETVGIVDGKVHIDGVALDEPYVTEENLRMDHSLTFAPVRVPDGHYFMMGDNWDNSMDSRFQAMTRREDLTGRVVARLF